MAALAEAKHIKNTEQLISAACDALIIGERKRMETYSPAEIDPLSLLPDATANPEWDRNSAPVLVDPSEEFEEEQQQRGTRTPGPLASR
jgi:hypothetical protein